MFRSRDIGQYRSRVIKLFETPVQVLTKLVSNCSFWCYKSLKNSLPYLWWGQCFWSKLHTSPAPSYHIEHGPAIETFCSLWSQEKFDITQDYSSILYFYAQMPIGASHFKKRPHHLFQHRDFCRQHDLYSHMGKLSKNGFLPKSQGGGDSMHPATILTTVFV